MCTVYHSSTGYRYVENVMNLHLDGVNLVQPSGTPHREREEEYLLRQN